MLGAALLIARNRWPREFLALRAHSENQAGAAPAAQLRVVFDDLRTVCSAKREPNSRNQFIKFLGASAASVRGIAALVAVCAGIEPYRAACRSCTAGQALRPSPRPARTWQQSRSGCSCAACSAHLHQNVTAFVALEVSSATRERRHLTLRIPSNLAGDQ